MFVNMFGYSQPEAPSVGHWLELAVPDEASKQEVRSIFTPNLPAGKVVESCLKARSKDGLSKTLIFRAFCIDGDRRVLACEDVDNMVSAWDLVRPSETKYRNLVDNLTDFVFTLDLDGNVLNVNRTAAGYWVMSPKKSSVSP